MHANVGKAGGARAALTATALTLLPRLHRGSAVPAELAQVEPGQSYVRLIASPEDLERAVRRAAALEREMAEVLERRAERYESLMRSSGRTREIERAS